MYQAKPRPLNMSILQNSTRFFQLHTGVFSKVLGISSSLLLKVVVKVKKFLNFFTYLTCTYSLQYKYKESVASDVVGKILALLLYTFFNTEA